RASSRARSETAAATTAESACHTPGSTGTALSEPGLQVIADAKRIGHDGERGVDRPTRREEAGVHHVEVVQLVRLAVHVECGRRGIVAEPDRAVLVRHAGERDALAQVEAPREQAFMTFMAMHAASGLLLHELFQLLDEASMSFLVVRAVVQHDTTLAIEG